jgi:AraC-like DNA-binding protein/CheY-like chemotaxis protein
VFSAGESVTGHRAKPLLLWFDLTSQPQDPELRVACARYFQLACLTRLDHAFDDVARLHPDALCFDFDRPDRQRLQALQDLKRAYERLPVLMLTQEHSESLAVWAFRAQVWNYFVKPVPIAELLESVATIAEIVHGAASPQVVRRLNPRVPPGLAPAPTDARSARLYPALEYVRQNYGAKLTQAEAAALCGMTRFAFSRHFHEAFGVTFSEHVIRSRIAEARRLLMEGGHTVTDVAYATGFNDASYFARTFRRLAGKLPSDYREATIESRRATLSPDRPGTTAVASRGDAVAS